jgi:DNA-binding NarL/FixJ family response regulator
MGKLSLGSAAARVLIVDAQPLFRLGLLTLLQSAYPHWTVSEADTTADIRGLLWEGAIDLLFIDSHLLGHEAADHKTSRRGLGLVSSIVAIASSNDPITTLGCAAVGAHATIARTDPISRALTVIAPMAVHSPTEVMTEAISNLVPPSLPDGITTAEIRKLTPRQIEVLRLLGQGQSNKVIARDLGLSVSTVKAHLNTVFRALGARNRVEAVVRARPFQEIELGT